MEGENLSVPVLYEANATDFFNKGLGTLPDALTAVVTEERNGEFIFEMTYPADGARADLLENNRIIKVDAGHVLTDQRFVIKKTTPQMSEDGKIYIDVYAEHISYITNDLALKPSVTVNGSANDAIQQWQKAIIDSNEITADSDITTSNSTSWTIDKVQTARQALGGVDGSILDVWGGEYLFDNLHISLKKQRGSYANTLLAYGRNITSFQQEENIESTYTSIYPYATLSSANGDTSSLYTIDNYVVDSQYVGNYPNRKILPVDFSSSFENVKVGTKASDASDSDTTVYMTVAEVQSQLKALAQQYITSNDVGIPTVSISVSFVDLSKTSNYADVAPLEQLDLCDIVPVRFTKLGIDTAAKVTHAEWNVLTDSYDKIELGSITPTLGQTLSALTTVAQAAKQVAQDAQNNATIAWQSADGKTTTFKGSSSQAFPTAQHIGDLYWRENGDTTEVYIWDGSEWAFQFSNKTGQNISEAVDKAMSEADTAKQNANTAVEAGNQALTKAQTAIDAANTAADNASTANANASTALNNAAVAVNQAQSAASDASSATKIANAVQQTVTDLKDGSTMTIAELESGLALKITKDDMNTALQPYATQSWTSTEISATANEINSSIASVKKTADGNTTDVTSLKQRADGFDTSISNLSTTKADQSWTTNQISATATSLTTTIASVQTQVNNSAVGTNLLLGTSDFAGWALHGNTTQGTTDGLTYAHLYTAASAVAPDLNLAESTTYTVSFDALGYTAGTAYIYIGYSEDSHGNIIASDYANVTLNALDGASVRVSLTFTTLASFTATNFNIGCGKSYNTGGSVYIRHVKLERGSHATDYSANPADNATVTSVTTLSATVDKLSTTVSGKVDNTTYTSKMTQLDNAISTKVESSTYNTEVNQLSNMINSKVSQTDFNSLGQVNLVPNGGFISGMDGWTGNSAFYYSDVDSDTVQGHHSIVAQITNASSSSWSYVGSSRFVVKAGQKISMRADIMFWDVIDDPILVEIELYNDGLNGTSDRMAIGPSVGTSIQGGWETFKYENYTVPDGANAANVRIYFKSNGKASFTRIMVTPGATIGAYVDNFANYSQIQQLSDNINLRVQKNDVINQINVSSESILIAGNKVHITGSTTIDNAVIKSAMIDSLSADKVTFGTLNGNLVNVTNINVNNIVGDTTSFVKSNWSSAYGSNVSISSSGMDIKYGKNKATFDNSGVHFTMPNSNHVGETVGGITYMANIDNLDINGAKMYVDLQHGGDETGFSVRNSDGSFSDYITINGSGAGKDKGIHIYKDFYTHNSAIHNGLKIADGSIFSTGSNMWISSYNTLNLGVNDKSTVTSGMTFGGGWMSINSPITKDVKFGGGSIFSTAANMWITSYNTLTLGTNNGNSTASGVIEIGGGWAKLNGNYLATSLLSKKRNIQDVDVDDVRSEIRAVDIKRYQYVWDYENGSTSVVYSPIIDDVNEKPKYHIPFDWISEDGTARNDTNALGYTIVAVQDLYNKIDDLQSQITKLKGSSLK